MNVMLDTGVHETHTYDVQPRTPHLDLQRTLVHPGPYTQYTPIRNHHNRIQLCPKTQTKREKHAASPARLCVSPIYRTKPPRWRWLLGEQARRFGARLCWHGFWGDDMGLYVDRLSGEYVGVEIADTEVLQAIAEDYHDRLVGKQGRLWPWERRWLASNLNIIIEELVVRSHEEPS